MSYSQITARVTDQTIQLVNSPLLASGSEGVLQVKCSFDELWSGYGKTAVFYRNKEQVFHVVMTDGAATVPHEVIDEEGFFYFGVMGVAENTRTTEVVCLELKQGAITLATAETQEPTPNIYEQLLASFGKVDTAVSVERARVDELMAMRNTQGALTYPLSDEYISNGTIVSNGAIARIEFDITKMSLVAGGWHRTDYCITPGLAPLGPMQLETTNSDIQVMLEEPNAEGWARLLIENYGDSTYTTDMVTHVRGYYPLATVSIPEVADIRTAFDGTSHATAGSAVRWQVGRVRVINGAPDPDAFSYVGQLLMDSATGALYKCTAVDADEGTSTWEMIGSGGGSSARLSNVTLRASAWTGSNSLYSQVVTLSGITEYSKVDLLPSVEQLAIFHNKDVAFVTENEDGVVTVYAIGDKPTQDYTMQVSITEVVA